MAENNLQGILGVSMDKIREMVDVNTIVGEAIHTPDGVTLIPVSRVSYGLRPAAPISRQNPSPNCSEGAAARVLTSRRLPLSLFMKETCR